MKRFWVIFFPALIIFFGVFLSLFFTKSVQAQECTGLTAAPNLFRIDREPTQAILYFSPVTDASDYSVFYGFSEGQVLHSIKFGYPNSTGVVVYTVNNLDPNQGYYFRVSGTNGCGDGPSSSWVSDGGPESSGSGSSIPVSGSETIMFVGIASVAFVIFGLLLFAL